MLQKTTSLRTLLSLVMVAVAGTTLVVSAFLVVLTAQLRRRIAITLGREREEAVLSVSDSGIGIEDEDLNRVFEPFRRTGASRESFPGVGLGLFVVRRIVQAHGGRIEVDSARGRGSTFRVRLPVLRGAERTAPVEVAEMSTSYAGP